MKTQFSEQFAQYRDSIVPSVRPLFDRFHLCDLAIKVVGVGSVGTRCAIALFVAGDDDPLFLQIKEARASVLEPYAGKSVYSNHGERVVVGQRMIQSASDLFLGWTRAKAGFDVYIRQLRDMKMSAVVEGWDFDTLRMYTRICAWSLAQAHARTGDAAMISGYMGSGRSLRRRDLRIRGGLCGSDHRRSQGVREGDQGGTNPGDHGPIVVKRIKHRRADKSAFFISRAPSWRALCIPCAR